ncbi:MAG: hypothetical protein A2V67_18295 [Deltaproteobacteria bacterium RBG_13_61_14]|nr:MAG: hypothetical protein A2V67_18295 [Deltaproteobacteria bacterium RBG_13_61_14]
MRILLINKFFFGLGGTETYLFEIREALKKAGHQVAEFAMRHPKNRPSEFSDYFVPELNLEPAELSFWDQVRTGGKVIYSREARRRLARLIRDFQPDLAHLHNIHRQLTPSILFALHRARVPMVWTLHDLQLACPNHMMFDPEEEVICEACRGRKYYRAISRECIKGSPLASAAGALESYLYAALGIYRHWVTLYLSPSQFLRNLLREEGFPSSRLVHLPNYADTDRIRAQFGGEGYGLFAGRLSPEKGLHTLLSALARVPEQRFYILGAGPLAFELRRRADHLGLKQVRFLGRLSGANFETMRRQASFVVVPSECYENCPFSVLEAFAAGKAVLASRIGGIPELVRDGETGFLFPPGDAEAFAAGIRRLAEHPRETEALGRQARRVAEDEYSLAVHLDRLLAYYQRALGKSEAGKEDEAACPSATPFLPSATDATHAA